MKPLFASLAVAAATLCANVHAADTATAMPATVAQLQAMSRRFAPTDLTADTARLSAGDRVAIAS